MSGPTDNAPEPATDTPAEFEPPADPSGADGVTVRPSGGTFAGTLSPEQLATLPGGGGRSGGPVADMSGPPGAGGLTDEQLGTLVRRTLEAGGYIEAGREVDGGGSVCRVRVGRCAIQAQRVMERAGDGYPGFKSADRLAALLRRAEKVNDGRGGLGW